MANLLGDVRYAVRSFARRPGFTAVAVATLALGIGATTAIFSVVDAVLLRPLPFTAPERLAEVWMSGGEGGERFPFSVADFLDWRARNRAFASLAAFTDQRYTLTGDGEPEQVRGAAVSADFFATLGVGPVLGRGPLPEDDRPEAVAAVVLGDGFWRRRFGADPRIVGRTIKLNGTPRTVLGVMPPGFNFPPQNGGSLPGDVQLWAVMKLEPPARRGPYFLRARARLAPGVTLAQAGAELGAIGHALERDNPLSNADATFKAQPLTESMVGEVRPALLVLLAAVGFLLLIAAANVANLLLARAAGREREMAVRAALGAGRGRLVRQLLTESVLLSAAGALAGLLIAWWGGELLARFAPATLPRLGEVAVDGRVLGFTVLVALATGILFGLAPALQSSRGEIHEPLKEGSRGGESRGRQQVRGFLVAAEVAAALVLLVGAGLLLASFVRLGRAGAGFEPDGVWTARIDLPDAKYGEDSQIRAFYDRLLARVEALPGVQAAAVGMSLPPNLLTVTDSFTIEGQPASPGHSGPSVPLVFVSPEYFRALGVPLVAGRAFTAADREGAPLVVLVNRELVRRYFPGQDPVGRRFRQGGPERPDLPWREIVGVVGDVKYGGLDAAPEPAYYLPFAQAGWDDMHLVIRTGSAPGGLAAAVREVVRSLDRDLPFDGLRPMGELVAESVDSPRFRTLLLGAFGAAALALAAIGIYGVLSYAVAQRTREIGVRIALGARPGAVVRLVMTETLGAVAVGLAAGIAGALALTRLLRGLLYGVSPTDPWIFASVPLVLVGFALLAAWLPARRATRVEPTVALRFE